MGCRSVSWWRAAAALALAPVPTAATPRDFKAAQPIERVDYWQERQRAIAAALADTASLPSYRLVFIGDSITDFWLLGANPWVAGQRNGRAVWDESFAGGDPTYKALNLGISGDRTEHILHRLLPRASGGLGELDPPTLDPDYVVVMAGINNSWGAEAPASDSIVAGVMAIVDAVHARKPHARIVLQSLLPTDQEPRNRDVVRPVNDRLADIVGRPPYSSFARFLDLYPAFVDAQGAQVTRYFNDGLHPNEAGYRRWRDVLMRLLSHDRALHPRVQR